MIRAAAHNPGMVSALGINTGLIYGGGVCARRHAGGACRRARRTGALADAGHGIFGADRVLHRHRDRRHGLDLGALVGALLIGLIRSFGALGFPLFTEGLMYLFMVIVLVSRPTGLFGKEVA